MPWRQVGVGLVAALALVGALDSAAAAGEVWDWPAFTARPADILRAASAVPTDGARDVLLLLEEGRYRFNRDGRAVFRYRRVYKVLSADGVASWGSAGAGWAPWYQREPEVKVRVIDAGGGVHSLDPTSIVKGTPQPGSSHIYSDRLTLRAPLPGLGIGAVVEEELVFRDTAPRFGAGSVYTWWVGEGVPVHRMRLVVEAPAALRLQLVKRRLPASAVLRTVRRRGLVRHELTASSLPAASEIEPLLPAAEPPSAYVAFSTGRSWTAVARAYADIVDKQIRAGDVAELAAKLPRLQEAGRSRVIDAALALVNDNVRYTGLELGESAIVPWTPQQTWQRRYGDCKDKATLLVALLRRAGVAADVVLLRAGTGSDIEPRLPGLSFNHAIVRVTGKKPVWIDPTIELARAGQLPLSDQGRWALVASASSRRLIKTPIAPSKANAMRELREITLVERGAASAVETTRFSGTYELDFRRDFRDSEPKSLRERFERYVESQFQAKTLVSYTHSDATDLATPLELRIEPGPIGVAETVTEEAEIFLRLGEVTNQLPSTLTDAGDGKQSRRRQPMALSRIRYEILYRITAPEGFAPRKLPAGKVLRIGPVSVSASFAQSGRVVTATLRLDTGHGRLEADEVERLRTELKSYYKNDSVGICFDQIGEAHRVAGRIPEAVEEFRRLIKLHPKEALHHSQLASALLSAGLGSPARAAARRAVKLEPRSVDALGMLGYVLEHDEVGRHQHPGADSRGARQAYERALAIDPDVTWVRANLAILLEHDRFGRRYLGDLDKAIAQYAELRRRAGASEWDDNQLYALLHAHRWKELGALARSLDPSSRRAAFRLAAAAGQKGEAGLRAELAALGLDAGARRTALEEATDLLAAARRYKLAAAALRGAVAGAANPAETRARIDLLTRIRRAEEVMPPSGDPKRALIELLAEAVRSPLVPARLRPLLARRGLSLGQLLASAQLGTTEVRRSFERSGMMAGATADVMATVFAMSVEGSAAAGWRILATEGFTGAKGKVTAFLVSERGGPRLLATGDYPAIVAAEAARLASRGKLAAARQWLDWASEIPASGALFATLWTKGSKAPRERAELAAATLMATHPPTAARAASILERCPREKTEVALACDKALTLAYFWAKDLTRSLEVADRLVRERPDDEKLAQLRASIALAAGRSEVVESRVAKLLGKNANDPLGRKLELTLLVSRGDFAKAIARLEGLSKAPDVDTEELNLLAWLALFQDRHGDDMLEIAKRAVRGTTDNTSAVMNTVAAVHAARGEYVEARDALLESMAAGSAIELRPQDWLVLGRLRAGYGFVKEAREAYRRIKRPTLSTERGDSFELGRHWESQL